MTIHINAKKEDLSDFVLLPGDPKRAEFIAQNYLRNSVCYNEVRGMLGFTGFYNGKRISVQGSGMGMPSMSIYATELATQFDVKKLIRIGSCGAMQKDIKLLDVILAMGASTDSAMNRQVFGQNTFSTMADFGLLTLAYQKSKGRNLHVKVGHVLTSDAFYHPVEDAWKTWAEYGVSAVEMETAALYTVGARYGVKTLSILTVSDHLLRDEQITPEDRERSLSDMIELALELGTQ